MNSAQLAFYLALSLAGVAFIIGAIRAARRRNDRRWPTPVELVVGFVTDFFDTLGIGSFAPTTAIYVVIAYAAFAMLRSAARRA
jgi:hypothetical protein